eukprot:SAG31_NODE_32204_length_358_cov_1.783784_1_plen_102_part_00
MSPCRDAEGYALYEKQEIWAVADAESVILATDSATIEPPHFADELAPSVPAEPTGVKVKKEKRTRAPSDYNKFMSARMKELKQVRGVTFSFLCNYSRNTGL